MNKYTREQVEKESIIYFNGDSLARDVWINKYALKDSFGNIYELTPNDMHERLANELNRIEEKYPNPLSKEKILGLIKNFKYIVPQGGPMAGIGNNLQTVSLSNCFVIGNGSDSYGGITLTDQEQVQLMKRRGGVGHDLSHLRPKGTPVKNSALTSTGVVPFMERYSNSTKEVAQDGRRGALMLSISVKHPDAEDFIDAKMTKGKVTGANVSVRLTDEFMKCAIEDKPFIQQFPIDSDNPTVTKEINARSLWEKIIHNAWKSAEPGLMFWDTISRESIPDCYAEHGFKTVSTNPCIIGDSMIATADGRNAVSIKQLAEEGKDVPVYSKDENGQVQIKWGRNPRKTGIKKEVWKLTMDDGSEFVATPDHNMYLKDGSRIELKDLSLGDSLSSFYSYSSNNGYRQISSCGSRMVGGAYRSRRQYRLVFEFFSGLDHDYKNCHIHHMDFDKSNDSITNLVLMCKDEHKELHSSKMKGKNNPYYKMSDEWKFNFASHPGEQNPKYIDISNDEILEHGKKLYKQKGRLTRKLWFEYAKDKGLPQFLANDFRFGSFTNFRNQVIDNHKVVRVEFQGYEDVYNLTVDDNHNYIVLTSNDDDKYITSGGICVKNCGEIPLNPYDSCRLLAINLYSYVENPFTSESKFNFDLFKEHAQYAQRLMDDIVDLEIEKIDQILNKIKIDPEPDYIKLQEVNLWEKIREKGLQGRRTGLGITSEGDMLAALGLIYGTKEATNFAEEIHKTLAVEAYKSSILMAEERGSFEVWNLNNEFDNPFIKRVYSEIRLADEINGTDYGAKYKKTGRRNIALLTIAPTGSVSIMTQTTSGIEPAFLVSYKRKRKINPNDKNAKIDYVDSEGIAWERYNVFHPTFKIWADANGYDSSILEGLNDNELNKIIKKSPYYKATSNDVDWVEKVHMQGAVQKWVDHSISVTVNLPNEVTEDIVSKVYETGWKSGCKGITVYRDGSRDGVLETNNNDQKVDIFKEIHAPRRPKTLKCDVIRFQNKGEKWIGFLGLLENRPYEVFSGLIESVNIPSYIDNGEIVKIKKEEGEKNSRYDFRYIDKDGYTQTFVGLSRAFNREFWNVGRLISAVLRHGMPLPNVMQIIDKIDLGENSSDDITSWKSGIKRMIKRYIKDGTIAHGQTCPDCGNHELTFNQGCLSCPDCGWGKCD